MKGLDGSIERNPLRMLTKSKNASIYRQIGRNRLIDAFHPDQRSGLNASNRIVKNISRSSDL